MTDSTSNAAGVLGQLSRERALRDAAWVAEFLNVSKSWVHEASASGTLPVIRVGDAVRFDPDVIKAWGRSKTSFVVATAALKREDAPEFLTVDEAAALLKINRNTLYEAIRLGQVPGVMRIGRLLRLRRVDLTGPALTLPSSDDLLPPGQGGSSLKENK